MKKFICESDSGHTVVGGYKESGNYVLFEFNEFVPTKKEGQFTSKETVVLIPKEVLLEATNPTFEATVEPVYEEKVPIMEGKDAKEAKEENNTTKGRKTKISI